MLLPDASGKSFVVSKIVFKLATCCDAIWAAILRTPRMVGSTPFFFFFFVEEKEDVEHE